MNNKNKNKSGFMVRALSLLLFLASFLVAGNAQAANLGAVPGRVTNYDLTRGSVLQETVHITREDAREALKASVSVNIPGAESWVTVDQGKTFNLKSGEKDTPVVIKIAVPTNAEYKEYKGTVDIIASPSVLQGTVAIATGVSIAVDFKVSEKKINSFVVKNVVAKEARAGEKIILVAGIQNTGNVESGPTKAILDIYDAAKKNIITSKNNSSDLGKVAPFTSKDVKMEFDSKGLETGNYWGKLKVYNGAELTGEYDVGITILPKGAVKAVGEKETPSGKSNILVLVVAILAVVAGMVILNKKNFDSKPKKKKKK